MIEIENYIISVICTISSKNIYLTFSSDKKKNDTYAKIKNILKRYKTSYNF